MGGQEAGSEGGGEEGGYCGSGCNGGAPWRCQGVGTSWSLEIVEFEVSMSKEDTVKVEFTEKELTLIQTLIAEFGNSFWPTCGS
jgi:hypothetical protein